MSRGLPRGRTPGPAGGRPAGTRRWRLVRAGRDAVPPSARRFMQRARRRRIRAALPWAVAGAVLALAGLSAWIVYGTGVFGVRHLRVAGVDILSPDQVRTAAAVPEGIPLARVEPPEVARRVAALAPVDRVRVLRDWPDTLVIEVVERTPAAAVPRDGRFAIVDGSGVVFRTVVERPAGLPLLRVAAPSRADSATRAALSVLAALTPELREQLTGITAEGPARIRLLLRGGRIVVWGDASHPDTKARVATALLAHKGKTIDVSAPDVVTIR